MRIELSMDEVARAVSYELVRLGKGLDRGYAMSHTHKTSDGIVTLIHNSDWSGDVEIIISPGDGTNYGTKIEGNKLLSGNFYRNLNCQVSERNLRRAVALAVYVYLTDLAVERIENIPLDGVV